MINNIHLFCYFKNYFKAVLTVPVKSSVNWRNKHAFNRCSCKDLKGNSSQLYLLNEHGDLYFLLQISDHYIVGNNQGKFKKKLCQLLFLWNHLKVVPNSFQHFPRLRFWWVIITTLYQLVLQSWYQTNAQWLVNTVLSFLWHNMLL